MTRSLLDELRERRAGTADDVLARLLPLFRQVEEVHAAGRVAPLEGLEQIRVADGRAYFENAQAHPPRLELARVEALERATAAAFDVVGQSVETLDADAGDERREDLLLIGPDDAVTAPALVVAYASWEHKLGHHDALTDLYVLGLVLASAACGLDFTDRAQAAAFARHRRNLFALAPGLNPVLAKCIVRLTELRRHRRAQDLPSLIRSLERYRDQDLDLELDLARIPGFHAADLRGRSQLVLGRLRERLFEVSRRNRLLYFKPTLQTLNLTFASVPILLDVKNVRSGQIFHWQPEVERLLAQGTAIPLSRYLRFEDAPYVPSVLDKLIADARRDTAEFGFSQLRLVIAFLRWHNLKENAAERIDSPLLLVPVELSKKKGVRDSYVLRAAAGEAEVNPVLRHHLKQLYGISLPHAIDLAETTVQAFVDTLERQVQASEPGVALNRIDRPQVELIHKRARRRLDQYRRRLRVGGAGLRSFRDLDYSYSRENFQPLGLRLFLDVVRPSPFPLHDVVSRERPVHEARMAASGPAGGASEKERLFVTFQEGGGPANPYTWDFDSCSLTLGNFNYRKMSLVRDYDTLIETGRTGAPFERLFSLQPKALAPEAPPPTLADRFPVVACDPTQLRAIALAATGNSFIVQGPPGTGKSQTITNLIADQVALGKRILFVCEKRAAIDVVYHRLRQRGLHPLACLIHDSQADKKEFILDLKATYERLLSEADEPVAEGRRRRCLAALERAARPIADFDAAMGSAPAVAGLPLRELLLRSVALSGRVPELAPEEEDELPAYAQWVRHADVLTRLGAALRHATRDGLYSSHPLAALAPEVATLERPRQAIDERLRAALLGLDRVAALCREHGLALGEGDAFEKLRLWSRYAAAVQPLAARGLVDLLQPDSAASERLRAMLHERQTRDEALATARRHAQGWRQKLEADDLAAALAQARALGTGLGRFFKGDFWRLRRVLGERYDFSRHAVRPSWVQVLERLEAEYAAGHALDAIDAQARREYGAERGLDAFCAELDGVRTTVRDLLGGADRERAQVLGPEPGLAIRGLVALAEALDEVERSLSVLQFPPTETLAGLAARARRVMQSLDRLPDFLPCLEAASSLQPELLEVLRDQPLDLTEIEAAVAARTLAEVWRGLRDAARFDGSALERQAARLEREHRRWLELNALVVLERARSRFRERVALASQPSVRLSKAQDELKRRYNAGRRELEHEFGKTMRYKSVRGLLAGPAGEVILDLKPVWLMSPLSVSDTLPIDAGYFDLVVFDEASQIPLEEAVPALFRAGQTIVSGDPMQLPPTNFFSATRKLDEELTEGGDEDETVASELDGNSFLSHAARNLASTMLGWHYRSRSESLISFSNAAFYGGRLLTVPERAPTAQGTGAIRVASPDEGTANAQRLTERPVSFHWLEHGRYESRRNAAEAAYIAALVQGLLRDPERPSIGIVAFSEAQQSQIEEALERLAERDPELRARLEEEYEREEDGQFAGLLVKNLENIQGDERDVILLSVCYGYGPDGRMLMNFGPINQGGGEKRLNVAFSRARRHMAVISSIRHGDVKNVYNDGANALRHYLQYAAAMSEGDLRTAAATLAALGPARRDATAVAEDPLVQAIEAGLRERGLETAAFLGQSHFRCPLAVRRPGDAAYRVAVFVDTLQAGRESDVIEREVLKPGLLRNFGWGVVPVLVKDWQEAPAAVLDRIERRLDGEVVEAADEPEPEEEPEEVTAPPRPSHTEAEAAPGVVPLSGLLPGQKRCFEFVGGSSSKFWHVTVDGAELVVVYGRIGRQGQVNRKPFPTPDLARAEGERLIREKLAKGYQPVDDP